MAWASLIVAGLLEVVWVYFMHQSNGFTRPLPTVATVGCMAASFWLLGFAMRLLPMGTAYAAWTGIGATGAFVVGVVALGEPMTVLRVVAATLIVSGIVLMSFGSGH